MSILMSVTISSDERRTRGMSSGSLYPNAEHWLETVGPVRLRPATVEPPEER